MIFTPLPLSQTVTHSQTPSPPWSVTYFMDGPVDNQTFNDTLQKLSGPLMEKSQSGSNRIRMDGQLTARQLSILGRVRIDGGG